MGLRERERLAVSWRTWSCRGGKSPLGRSRFEFIVHTSNARCGTLHTSALIAFPSFKASSSNHHLSYANRRPSGNVQALVPKLSLFVDLHPSRKFATFPQNIWAFACSKLRRDSSSLDLSSLATSQKSTSCSKVSLWSLSRRVSLDDPNVFTKQQSEVGRNANRRQVSVSLINKKTFGRWFTLSVSACLFGHSSVPLRGSTRTWSFQLVEQ